MAISKLAPLALLILAGCAASATDQSKLASQDVTAAPTWSTEIRRTAYGVPHIKASDYGGLGYGLGYASAQDNICELAERNMTAAGTRAQYLGPGENNANVASDLYHKRLIQTGELERLLNGPAGSVDTPSPDARAFIRGFAAGVSRYVRDTGAANITDPRCKGAPWVREVSETDYWRQMLAGQVVIQMAGIAAAAPPGLGQRASVADDPLVETTGLGSNAYGLGREVTKSGHGVLLGNPHYPWNGQNRFYRTHLMIPGKLNVVGAGLVTTPLVGIGHTDRIAWSHTVSTARRFGYFELKLDPADATRYIYDGKSTSMTRMDVTVQVKNGDALTPVTHTFYTTRFGPMVQTKAMPWTATRGYAIAVMPEGLRTVDQYLAIWQAKSVGGLKTALDRFQGTGFNTTAVDADGNAMFGDFGMIPNVTPTLVDACATSEFAKEQWKDNRVPVLDGSRAACTWGTDKDSTAPGVFGASKLPHLIRQDYVTQSNDSYWLSNPKQPLEGYSPVMGDERTARSLRTRLGLEQVADRVAGVDGLDGKKFDLKTLEQVLYKDRNLGAELVRDDLVAACRKSGKAKLAPACDALAKWDLKENLDSRGAHLFHLFAQAGGLKFKVPFNAADPVHTPNTLDVANPEVLAALESAVDELNELDIPLDAPLRAVQNETRNGEAIPIHGGAGPEGVFNVITVGGKPQPKVGWTNIVHGSSWIMAVEFTDHGPMSQGILTYSQSTNPNSPFYSDQTHLYSRKGWDDLRFTDAAVAAGTLSTTTLKEGPADCAADGWRRYPGRAFQDEAACRRGLAAAGK